MTPRWSAWRSSVLVAAVIAGLLIGPVPVAGRIDLDCSDRLGHPDRSWLRARPRAGPVGGVRLRGRRRLECAHHSRLLLRRHVPGHRRQPRRHRPADRAGRRADDVDHLETGLLGGRRPRPSGCSRPRCTGRCGVAGLHRLRRVLGDPAVRAVPIGRESGGDHGREPRRRHRPHAHHLRQRHQLPRSVDPGRRRWLHSGGEHAAVGVLPAGRRSPRVDRQLGRCGRRSRHAGAGRAGGGRTQLRPHREALDLRADVRHHRLPGVRRRREERHPAGGPAQRLRGQCQRRRGPGPWWCGGPDRVRVLVRRLDDRHGLRLTCTTTAMSARRTAAGGSISPAPPLRRSTRRSGSSSRSW